MFYFNLTVIPIGLVLNFISILVFARKEFKKTTIGFYNIIICLVNISSLIFLFIINYGESIGKDILTSSSINCTAFSFLIRFLYLYPAWLQIVISIDRLICISCPLEYKDKKHKKICISLILAILFLLVLLLNIPSMFTKLNVEVELNITTNKTTTIKYCALGRNLIFIRDLINFTLRLIVPIVLLAAFNSIILFKLVRLRKEFSNFNSFMVKEYKFTLSTLVLNVFYLISLVFNLILILLINTFQYDFDYINGNIKFDKTNRFFYIGLSMLAYNYICNFIANIKTNVYFRKELINLLKTIRSAYDVDNSFLRLTKNGLIIPWGAKLNANGDIVFK